MRELKVVEIRVSTGESPPLVVLAEADGAGRLLPVWMSHGGASAIFSATEEPDDERPNIHDLAWRLAEAATDPVQAVRITSYSDGQFYAELVLGENTMPCRVSDAIALALRIGCPIQCAEIVLDEAGVSPDDTLVAPVVPAEDEVERFREFLDTVTPEDFTGDEGKP